MVLMITPPSTPEQRRDAIRSGLDDIKPVIIAAYQARDWEHFGYGSWSEYLSAEFGQLRLPRGERAEAVIEMREQGMSQRAIGDALGVSQPTVLRDLSPDTNVSGESVTGIDGKSYPATRPHVAHNSGANEWYTPPQYIAAAVDVMGEIDLDPASSPEANTIVGATDFYTKETNGLTQPWHGRIWLNPPYASDLVTRFTDKLCDEYTRDNISEACLLSNNATETKWFQKTARVATAICFPSGRIQYWTPDRETKTPLQGQVVLYFGPNREAFVRTFRLLGIATTL